MKIEIKLFASLTKYKNNPRIQADGYMDIEENATISEVIEILKIPEELIKLMFLNGIHAKKERGLKDGDRLGLFPPIGGG